MSFLIQDVTDGKLVKIAEDALDVADRIREIDEGYEIYYNRAKNRFEIYKKGERQAVLPFDELDERTVTYLRKTRIENAAELIQETDSENLKREQSIERAKKDEREYKLGHLVKYLENDRAYVPRYDEL